MKMKTLFLLRHAQADTTIVDDKSRPLTALGQAQAAALGKKMHTSNMHAEYILCSPAMRTRQTLDGLLQNGLNTGSTATMPADFPEDIFYASTGALLHKLNHFNDAFDSALIINHNPAIHQLAYMLSSSGDETSLQSLATGYTPCTLTHLTFTVTSWADITPGMGNAVTVIPPLVW